LTHFEKIENYAVKPRIGEQQGAHEMSMAASNIAECVDPGKIGLAQSL
jgi:hypothetical protein